jgi:hypothetical protein
VDTAASVLARLARLERLDLARSPPSEILAELRELAEEAEAWAREEGDQRALRAALELRRRTEGMSRSGPNG